MKRVLVLVSLFAALQLVGAATAAGPFDWKLVPYYESSRSEFRLQTSVPSSETRCDWKGGAGGIYSPGNATVDYPDFNCTPNFVWAKKCVGGPQTVSFTKRIYVPGPPKELAASLLSFGGRPLTMRIEINGSAALTTTKSVHKRNLSAQAPLFKLGWNVIGVEATKPNTGKAPCNSSAPQYGVYAQIRALVAADMAATAPVGVATDTGVFQGKFTVTNKGPSKTSVSSVHVGAYTSKLQKISSTDGNRAIVVQGNGIDPDKCLYSYSAIYYKSVSYTGYSASCPIAGLKPGESVEVTVTYKYLLPTGPFYEEWPISWGGSGDLHDPNTTNSSGMRLQKICRNDPAKPDPRCTESVTA